MKLNKRPRNKEPAKGASVPVAKEPPRVSRRESEKARYELKRLWGVSAIKLGSDLDRLRLLRQHAIPGTTTEEMSKIMGMPHGYMLDLEALDRRESND